MSWYLFKPPRFADLIVRAKSDQDIQDALAYARENKLKVTVRSGGHNPAKAVLRNGGMLLDLSELRSVQIDAAARTAWVEPGIHSENLLAQLVEHKLDFPAAHTGVVPIGGYVIGGGLGWNMPERGIACRSILAAEVITADGSKLTASADENSDLWWAIRGCGPGFLLSLPGTNYSSTPLYPAMTKASTCLPSINCRRFANPWRRLALKRKTVWKFWPWWDISTPGQAARREGPGLRGQRFCLCQLK